MSNYDYEDDLDDEERDEYDDDDDECIQQVAFAVYLNFDEMGFL